MEFIAVYTTTEDEKKKLEETFRSLDKDHNGTLSYDELVEGLNSFYFFGVHPLTFSSTTLGFTIINGSKEMAIQMAQKTLETADFDRSGQIDYSGNSYIEDAANFLMKSLLLLR